MRRPRWILALVFAMIVASVFAWLGQWQMDSAVRNAAVEEVDTETPRPLQEASDTLVGVTDEGAGVVVHLDGAFVRGDSRVVSPRVNDGQTGAWVVGHLVTEAPDAAPGAHLAVAIGWAADEAAAERAIEKLEADPEFSEPRTIEGRFMPPEGPQVPKAGEDPQVMHTMIPAFLANVWTGVDSPVYSGYLVMHDSGAAEPLLAEAGLDPVDSVAPLPAETVNWLNIFYGVEWIVFAGFALFLWYRLTRDAWEKEHELKLLQAADAEAAR
ncbi:SURF1 family protein [Leucobacter tenebrionis]|uniref:SURF1 family protein n=1 Tax=Leucobacter tenebrionis TaxID=2873270 RepID=UPI001CA71AC2|nr:SURF1 family cytochrome oxidase biogenesis protein [Leucobacter tenebrionis]QZY53388.1 hypothetical protein KVY00_04675 [Leucobacter tenebrionis]